MQAYFDTLSTIFALESKILSGTLPHYGERGANDELRVRQFLARVLPKKYSVGTGFVVCSNPAFSPSAQTDIVIFDEIQNSPLHRELAADVFPVEMVYGTVEVKGVLRSKDLAKTISDVSTIRSMARERWYSEYAAGPKDPPRQHESIVHIFEHKIPVPAPRSFVFAFSQANWKTPRSLKVALERAASRDSAHIHGLVVLEQGWYFTQEAFATPPRFAVITKDALLHFVKGMLHSLSSMPMSQMSISRYFDKRAD